MLLLDIGHSHTKALRLGSGLETPNMLTVEHNDLEKRFAQLQDEQVIAVPGAAEATKRCAEFFPKWKLFSDAKDLPECGAYQGMGVDRICAGIGALDLIGPKLQSFIVVNCGTFPTLTIWRRAEELAAGVCYEGGLIFPSEESFGEIVQKQAPHFPSLNTKNKTQTAEQLRAGVQRSIGAAIEQAVIEMVGTDKEIAVLVNGSGASRLGFKALRLCSNYYFRAESLELDGLRILMNIVD